jgi:hypothetical protein
MTSTLLAVWLGIASSAILLAWAMYRHIKGMFREDLRLDWRWASKLYELRDQFRDRDELPR